MAHVPIRSNFYPSTMRKSCNGLFDKSFRYQNGILLNGTNETLLLENVTSSDAGFYQCEVSLEGESVLSSLAEIETTGN